MASGTPATSAPEQSTTTATPEATRSDDDRVICKRETKGARFTKRVCRTKAEWARITADAEAAVKEIQERPGVVACPPTAPGC